MLPHKLTSAFWERAQEQGSRSTVLRPLGWLIALCGSGLLGAAALAGYHPVLTSMFGIAFGLSVSMYLFAYAYCLFKSPENLRTERYSIQKLAIERGFVGDAMAGIFRPEDTAAGKMIEAASDPAKAIEAAASASAKEKGQ